MVLPLNGKMQTKPLVATPGWDRSASFSPDGEWFAYESETRGQPEIFICRFNAATAQASGQPLKISDDGGRDPAWAPDGRGIYYLDLSQRLIEVDLSPGMAPRGSRRFDITSSQMQDFWTNRLSVAPDGRILIARPVLRPPHAAEIQVVVDWPAEVKSLSPAP